jgi:hypothetical protein
LVIAIMSLLLMGTRQRLFAGLLPDNGTCRLCIIPRSMKALAVGVDTLINSVISFS